jgi:uncharacterized protein YjiS (DUF1127 family)
MSKPLAHALNLSLGTNEGWRAVTGRHPAARWATGWLQEITVWMSRHQERKSLGAIAELNNYLLQDIGISRADALREAAKPFWQR